MSKVESKESVKNRAKAQNKKVHFGSLMELCFLKHAEKSEEFQKYKGRVVFRGDQVKDEEGYRAVFSEQGTSASHLTAAKFLDTISRFPGMKGEEADATSAYTQVILADMKHIVEEELWVTIPQHIRPESWKGIKDPVCPVLRNLYGHPLAGLLWEKHAEKILFEDGFELVPGWECL